MLNSELRMVQMVNGLNDQHVVEIIPYGFNIVHPRAEREARIQLSLCAFSVALRHPELRPPVGLYLMTGCSTDPDTFEPLELCGAQDWGYNEDGSVHVYGTCQKRVHDNRWHGEWRDGKLWAGWGGPRKRAPLS